MIESLFTSLTLAMSGSFALALAAAFGWGIMSILLSPCHLSSIPLIIGYISNQEIDKTKHSFSLALVFSIGILLTIALIGFITASMGRLMGDIGLWVNWPIGILFLFMGLYLMDIISWDWGRFNIGNSKHRGLWGAFILGLVFGIALGPCTFAFLAPVLGLVFNIASDHWLKAMMLIFAFGLGHCTLIVAAGSMTHVVQNYLNWSEKSQITRIIKKISGFFVLLGGLYFIYLTLS